MRYQYEARYVVWLLADVVADDEEQAADKALDKFRAAFDSIEGVRVIERDFQDGQLDELK